MTSAEVSFWRRKNATVHCLPMRAVIHERDCRANQKKARKYAANRHNFGLTGGADIEANYKCYLACRDCRRKTGSIPHAQADYPGIPNDIELATEEI